MKSAMNPRHALAAFAAASLLLAGCASQQVNPQILESLSAKGVSPSTAVKMQNARPLEYQDILELVRKGVPANEIIGYLESTQKVYNFGPVQLQALQQAGAPAQLINYLQETQGFYGRTTPAQSQRLAGQQKAAYYNSPLYQDEQPFAYNAPIVDDFYDSGYEESLYSPFSFN
jgi:outer membrane murein-binding lipoprotein Lpp